MKVLLWDIDGTLLDNDRAGMHAWLQALEEEHGGPLPEVRLNLAGMTDRAIARVCAREILGRRHDEELERRLLARYVELLPEWLPRRRRGRVLPGVRELLEAAAARPDLALALLTGNVEAGARLKLAHYGLDGYFSWGAFADVSPDRREIARHARRQAEERYGEELQALFVLGDTPHDIDCGKAIGARTVAIATGSVPLEALRAHKPWWLLERLPDPAEFLGGIDARLTPAQPDGQPC